MTAVDTFFSCTCRKKLRSHMRRLLTLQILPRIDTRFEIYGEVPTLIRLTVRRKNPRVLGTSIKHSRQITVSSSMFVLSDKMSSGVSLSPVNTSEDDIKSSSEKTSSNVRNELILDELFRLFGKIFYDTFNITGLCMEFGKFRTTKKNGQISSSPPLLKYFKRKFAMSQSNVSTENKSLNRKRKSEQAEKVRVDQICAEQTGVDVSVEEIEKMFM
mmetsp:Transcript_535/g.778  ORF Transcript_535/g.778 Transcript_535/m.778 type:complete len:215 (+) Transcript_535:63-707(+)